VIAGIDRVALRALRGGELFGAIAQHYIPPGISGFDESGAARGFAGFDWMRNPHGDRAISERYFRAAGHASGRYEGGETIVLVGSNTEPENNIAQAVDQQLRELGFETKLRLMTPDTMLTKFCGVSASEVHVCPSAGWARDFADAQTVLDPPFNGAHISPTRNPNWSELNDPALNREIERAKLIENPPERARAWAAVNRRVVELAPTIPYSWDYVPAVSSADVRGVQNDFTGGWDLSFTALR
jgi:peptide/nickel transport system substrate-binding protein